MLVVVASSAHSRIPSTMQSFCFAFLFTHPRLRAVSGLLLSMPLGSLKAPTSLAAVNGSAAKWEQHDAFCTKNLQMRHQIARKGCERPLQGQALQRGGWCLGQMVQSRLFGDERTVWLPRGESYRMPAAHVEADELILSALARLTGLSKDHKRPSPLSILDLGAGVGQYGHALQSRFPQRARWLGYDGAGDVEEYTRGFVRFADLTLPLALPRADWVVALEVGEHVPRAHELMLVRNLHAHACRGIILSWACYGGHQHVNRRPNEHVIENFARLGYWLDAPATREMRQPAHRARLESNRSHRVYGWFGRSLLVFRRYQRLNGSGCSSD
jgi:hypothetical protein